MVSTPVPGFITKKDAAENYQRSHRQITRDLADAMKVQDAKVLDNCRLRTEDGETREGIGVTPELLDQLRIDGKNPVWYLRTSWLDKIYGRRGDPRHRDQKRPGEFQSGTEQESDTAARPEMVHVLRERIHDLQRDKQDLREQLKITNQQIAARAEREKETNALIRDLHTLMADLQRRLLPPPTDAAPSQITEGRVERQTPKSAPRDAATVAEAEVISTAQPPKKGSHRRSTSSSTPTKQRRSRGPVRRKTSARKSPATKKERPPAGDAAKTTKSRSFLSRLFSR